MHNVCSGNGISLREATSIMADILNMKVNIIVDERLIRPGDNKKIIGSNKKIKQSLGWEPKFTLKQSLYDILNYWESNWL